MGLALIACVECCVLQPVNAQTGAPTFDNQIVPGLRIGPVALDGPVDTIVARLGKPDKERRFGIPQFHEVLWVYDRACINFTWQDQGLRPAVEHGLRGINVWCSRWATAEGVHVGSTIQEVVQALGKPDVVEGCTPEKPVCTLEYYKGLWLWVKNRNSPVYMVSVVPEHNPGSAGW